MGAKQIAENPMALELRRMQMITEVGAEQNTTTIILMPSDFVTLAKTWRNAGDSDRGITHDAKAGQSMVGLLRSWQRSRSRPLLVDALARFAANPPDAFTALGC